MDQFRIIPDGPKGFAVEVTYHSGRNALKRGFVTQDDAQTWLEDERVKAVKASRKRR